MKFCQNCGTQLEDNDLFCPSCGTKSDNSTSTLEKSPSSNPLLLKLKQKKVFIPLIIGIILIVCAIFVTTQIRKKVNINDYVSVSFNGYSGAGVATYKLDYEGFYKAILKAQGKSSDGLSDGNSAVNDISRVINSGISFTFDNTKNLKNGDKTTLKINCKEDAGKELGVHFVSENLKHTVKKLKEPKKINPFDDLSISFKGTSPDGYIDVEQKSKNSYLKGLSYKYSKNSEIKNGDKITITINANAQSALQNGYIFTQKSKDFTCEKLDEYLIDLTKLKDQPLAKMQKDTTDKIESFFAKNNEYISYDSLKYAGAYLLNSKSRNNNAVYLIYSLTASSKESGKNYAFSPTTVYYICEFDNVILKSDNTVDYDTPDQYYHSTDLTYGFFAKVPGYTDGAQMYNDLITATKDNYEHQSIGDITQFGQ